MMKKILYISDLDKTAPLFHSQVIPHISEMKKHFEVTVMVLQRSPTDKADDISNIYYRSVVGDYIPAVAKLNFITQRRRLQSLFAANHFDLIYSRGIRGGIVACFIKQFFYAGNKTHLNDTRGDSLDGLKNTFINRMVLHTLNKKLYSSVNILFAVSNFLKNKICCDYGISKEHAYVFPTFVPDNKFTFDHESRVSKRKELNYLDSDIVLLYSGNLAKWQNINTILEAFGKTANANLKMLFLTKEKEIDSLVNKYNIPPERIKVLNVEYSNITSYYHAADFGILIRDNNLTNRCAAPTKFSEYVNAGLSVIINEIDADYVRTFKCQKLQGILLHRKEELLECFDKLTEKDKKRNVIKLNTLGSIVLEQKNVIASHLKNMVFTKRPKGHYTSNQPMVKHIS